MSLILYVAQTTKNSKKRIRLSKSQIAVQKCRVGGSTDSEVDSDAQTHRAFQQQKPHRNSQPKQREQRES